MSKNNVQSAQVLHEPPTTTTAIMKLSLPSTSLLIGALWLSATSAFPAMLFDEAKREGLGAEELYTRLAASDASSADSKLRTRVLGVNPGFNAAAQRISTTGANAFVPPGPGDIRGPCPGLNSLANHNYLPHNGVPTFAQAIDATTKGKPSLENCKPHVDTCCFILT